MPFISGIACSFCTINKKNQRRMIDTPPQVIFAHTNGFPPRAMQEMGYSGGGLGKSGNGITSPIKATMVHGRRGIGSDNLPPATNNEKTPMDRVQNKIHTWPANTTLITGSSMICGIDENKLTRYNTKVRLFPGHLLMTCTTICKHYWKENLPTLFSILGQMMPQIRLPTK